MAAVNGFMYKKNWSVQHFSWRTVTIVSLLSRVWYAKKNKLIHIQSIMRAQKFKSSDSQACDSQAIDLSPSTSKYNNVILVNILLLINHVVSYEILKWNVSLIIIWILNWSRVKTIFVIGIHPIWRFISVSEHINKLYYI